MTPIIDSHTHVWNLDRFDYPWLTPDLKPVYRNFELDDIWTTASSFGVKEVILVQATTDEAETHALLHTASADVRVAGVVGWTDFECGDHIESIRLFAQHPLAKGLRPMIGDISDPRWILESRFSDAFDCMAEHQLILDAHARPDHLQMLCQLADKHPKLSIVLDHAGKPPIGTPAYAAWREALNVLSRRSNVVCKYSGLMTCLPRPIRRDSLEPIVMALFNLFGPERLIWGSDWPFMRLASDYSEWIELSLRLVRHLSPDEKRAIFHDNAKRIYHLEDRS